MQNLEDTASWNVLDTSIREGNLPADAPEDITIQCDDGVTLRGHFWPSSSPTHGCVIINSATGVQASYYHRYARFLAANGFNALTYDYRGIGLSRPPELRRTRYRWGDWGEYDFNAALRVTIDRGEGPIHVVGHSFGGVLPGLTRRTSIVQRMFTVGAQYAWWGDYASSQRLKMFCKWHVAMPVLTALFGYFPGKRLRWLEDLPGGVAYDWSFRRRKFEDSYPWIRRQSIVNIFNATRSQILAVTVTDDAYATPRAVLRTLNYFTGADRTVVQLRPDQFGVRRVGHFDLFHSRHHVGFWRSSLDWLRTGVNPWQEHVIYKVPPTHQSQLITDHQY